MSYVEHLKAYIEYMKTQKPPHYYTVGAISSRGKRIKRWKEKANARALHR